MKFQATFYILASLVTTALSATLAQLKTDVQAITTILDALQTNIINLPNNGATLSELEVIQIDINNLEQAIDKGTQDVKTFTGPLSEKDGHCFLSNFKTIEPIVSSSLKEIVRKKDIITNVDGGIFSAQAMLTNLESLKSSTSALGSAFVAIVLPDIAAKATSIMNDINAAFASAIAAYES